MTDSWSKPKRGWGRGECIAMIDKGTADERKCGKPFDRKSWNQERCDDHASGKPVRAFVSPARKAMKGKA